MEAGEVGCDRLEVALLGVSVSVLAVDAEDRLQLG